MFKLNKGEKVIKAVFPCAEIIIRKSIESKNNVKSELECVCWK